MVRSRKVLREHRLLRYEAQCWDSGLRLLVGIDEAGRGAWAGPLIAAAIGGEPEAIRALAASDAPVDLLRDSKTLDVHQRTRARERILRSGLWWATGSASAREIDALGIAAANRLAMERALARWGATPDLILIDACTIDHPAPQCGLIDGDAQSLLIACASILAKVERDLIMERLETEFAGFRFGRHRGYGTPGHQQELAVHGPCSAHRRSYAPVAAWRCA